MATTIDSNEFVLLHRWPTREQGWMPPKALDPANGGDHDVANASYPVGTTWDYFQEGGTGIGRGWARFTYLQLGTQDGTVALAARSVCGVSTAPGAATAKDIMYIVTNADASAILACGLAAVAISAMTNSYYGWFWTGGVCPESIVSGLAGNYLANGLSVGGMALGESSDEATAIGFVPATAYMTVGYTFQSSS